MTHRPLVAVYCGSRVGNDTSHRSQAKDLGRVLVKKGYGLIYGGGDTGLMSEVARAVTSHQGFVCGVITELLAEREGVLEGLSEIHVVRTMQDRKRMMFERAHCFVVLPGGTGTMDEFFEVLVLKELNQHQKPIVILNIDGYWDFLLRLLSNMEQEGFLHKSWVQNICVANNLLDLQSFL